VPEFKSEQREAQVNLTEVSEDPNQNSEEPKASFAQEGKTWSITPIFLKLMQLFFIYMVLCIKFVGVDCNPSCMILVPMI
jgi:hypothetical protein